MLDRGHRATVVHLWQGVESTGHGNTVDKLGLGLGFRTKERIWEWLCRSCPTCRKKNWGSCLGCGHRDDYVFVIEISIRKRWTRT
ncbi:leucine-rich repeat extensin-like protein 3 [Iris pallida]|uniref:Leucine-rich repeat extensin-like protein 3 n=1 Tax=Iris pallida TaxID=29817 RepID=A0AAX6FXL5_IRIPA|nr:leucine-rich repeat extensin-like protein 3 [Iris pallida]